MVRTVRVGWGCAGRGAGERSLHAAGWSAKPCRLLTALALVVCSQNVYVLDVSAEDAVYEDESRELAIEVVDAFNAKGAVARRIDESELPPRGCKAGPCLEKVAKGSDVLVTVDVVEISKGKLGTT